MFLRLINLLLLLTLSFFAAIGLFFVYLYGSVTILFWQILFFFVVISLLVFLLIEKQRLHNSFLFDGCFSRPTLFYNSVRKYFPYLLLLPGIITVLISFRMKVSYHGFFHSAYIFQIIAGRVPPENVTLPGFPATIYWIYHALIAVWVNLLNLPPPLISAWMNIVVLVSTIYWMRVLVQDLFSSKEYSPVFEMFVLLGLFGTNLFGSLHTFLIKGVLKKELNPDTIRPILLGGDEWINNLLEKFLNFTSFPIGVLFYIFILFLILKMFRKGWHKLELFLLLVSVIGVLLFNPASGVFISIVVFLSIAVTYIVENKFRRNLTKRGWLIIKNKQILPLIQNVTVWKLLSIAFLVAIVILWPTLEYISDLMNVFRNQIEIEWVSIHNIKSILSASYPLVPFFTAGVIQAWQKHDKSIIFLGLVCLLGYALTSIMRLPLRQESQFVYLSTIAMSIVSLVPLRQFFLDKKKRWKRYVLIGVFALLGFNLLLVGINRIYFQKSWIQDRTFQYKGYRVISSGYRGDNDFKYDDIQYYDIFQWARNNTPLETIIVVPAISKDLSTLYILSERLPYVVESIYFNINEGNDAQEKRENVVKFLFSKYSTLNEKLETLRYIRSSLPNRPIVIVYPHELERNFQCSLTSLLNKLYEGNVANLYSIDKLQLPQNLTLKNGC